MGLETKALAIVLAATLLSALACSAPAASSGGSGSGVCAPGGNCAPRYEAGTVLTNAKLDKYVTKRIPNLAGNMGLGNLAPDTTCEAASTTDSDKTVERA